MPRLKDKYTAEVAPALMKKFSYSSPMQVPRLEKIVVNCGCGDCRDNAKALEAVVKDITAITGQKAVEKVQAIMIHLEGLVEFLGENTACREMRKHVCAYLKGVPNSARVRQEVTGALTVQAYREALEKLES